MATGSNSAVVDFGAAGSAWGTISHYGFWDSTDFCGSTPLTTNRVVTNGATVTFPIGDVDIQSIPGEFSNFASRRALAGALGAGTINISLHTGAPGTNGTANEVTGTGYAREAITVSTLTISDP